MARCHVTEKRVQVERTYHLRAKSFLMSVWPAPRASTVNIPDKPRLQGLAELVTYVEVALNLMHRMMVTMDHAHLDFTVKKEQQTVLSAQKELSGLMLEPRLAMIACHAPVVNIASSRE